MAETKFPQIGSKVIYLGTSWDNGNDGNQILKSGTITKLGKDVVWLDHQHKSEDCLYSAFMYPDVPICREHLQAILDMIARHKQEQGDMQSKTYKLKNAIARGEIG